MSDDVIEVEVLQPGHDARIGGLRVLLDVEDRAEVVLSRRRIDDEVAGLVREHQPADGQVPADGGLEYGNRLVDAVEDVAEMFQDFGKDDPVRCLIHPEPGGRVLLQRSEEHTSEIQLLMRISYAVFCLKKKK